MEEILKKRDQILKKFNLMYNGLVKEYLAIKGERDDETNIQNNLENAKNVLLDKLKQASDEKMAIEVRIKQEEMKLKACSDETKQKLDLTKADIEEIRDGLLEKIKEYQKETNIEIRMFKDNRTIGFKFLANNQEIFVTFKDKRSTKAFYHQCVFDSSEQEKKDCMDMIIDEFNQSPTKDLKDFVLSLRDLFSD